MVIASKKITVEDLPPEVRKNSSDSIAAPSGKDLRDSIKVVTREAEKKLIIAALEKSGGKRSIAAKILDVDEKTLYKKDEGI